MKRAKVAIVHPQLGFGGSEAAALWAIETLKQDYSVTLITSGNVDLGRLNDYYGTSLQPSEFSILKVPLPPGLYRTAKFSGLGGLLFNGSAGELRPALI